MKRIVIISGLSGAGKSTALGFFEDQGYFCMDNVPSSALDSLISLVFNSNVSKAAMVVDVRSEVFGDAASQIRQAKERYPTAVFVLYLEASTQTIIERYALTRRRHPLGLNIEKAIEKERQLLAGIKEVADLVIDTTKMSAKELREKLLEFEERIAAGSSYFTFRIQSFGFKYGIPVDSDFIFDARFFPNPYYIPELKDKTGLDEEVKSFLQDFKEIEVYIEKIVDILLLSKKGYRREGRAGITASIGCSGGKHRSVYIAEKISEILKYMGESVVIEHRDISKE